jgi:hypothetical protein
MMTPRDKYAKKKGKKRTQPRGGKAGARARQFDRERRHDGARKKKKPRTKR